MIYPQIMPAARQTKFDFAKQRPKKRGRPRGTRVSHHGREQFERPTPVHVTVRMRWNVWNLRSRRSYSRISVCLERMSRESGLRVIEYSVLGNHIHLIVEADGHHSLSRGMQGLSIRIAKTLNRMMNRRGRVFDDHYDARLLRSPTQLVRAIAYVLRNHEHHYGAEGVDPFSSLSLAAEARRIRLSLPVTWLLRAGWRKVPGRLRLQGTPYG